MKKRLNHKSSLAEPQAKPDVTELIIKMQQQLVFLEKKIDTLLSQSEQRSSEAKPYSKPFRSFEPSHGRAEARYDHDRGERTFFQAICADCNTECEVPFRPSQGRPVYCKQCFSKHKGGGSFKTRLDDRPRHREITQEHPFNKYAEKKPVFKKRKR
ncbi:MAG: hypothetical protein Q8O30_07595 [Candidatus Omnitrophota bacterium]|nr:hypothetical protein [Candidatus Omnitrophota bacterium]